MRTRLEVKQAQQDTRHARGEEIPHSRDGGVPWETWWGLVAVSLSVFGMEWDVAWHRSIGRDSFWTPAHILIQLCGVLTALVCGYLVYVCTFNPSSELRARSVGVFGFRAPLGCFMAVWGGLAMLVSAPFDDWWHNAYGLDVQILSPPHTVLFIGLRLISAGFLVLIAGPMNEAAPASDSPGAGGAAFRRLQWMFLVMTGLIVTGHMLLLTVWAERPVLHTAAAYKHMAFGVLFLLPFVWQASRHRWAATIAVSLYTVIRVGEVLVFPLFPATPRLGPVLNPITHLVPAQFPILLIAPAVAVDLLMQRTGRLTPWLRGALAGGTAGAVLIAVEWPFANFLMSKASENRFFNTMDFDFSAPAADRVHQFNFVQHGWPLYGGLLMAIVYAAVAGLAAHELGRWLRGVRR